MLFDEGRDIFTEVDQGAPFLGQDSILNKENPDLYDPLMGRAHAGGFQVDNGEREWKHGGLGGKWYSDAGIDDNILGLHKDGLKLASGFESRSDEDMQDEAEKLDRLIKTLKERKQKDDESKGCMEK